MLFLAVSRPSRECVLFSQSLSPFCGRCEFSIEYLTFFYFLSLSLSPQMSEQRSSFSRQWCWQTEADSLAYVRTITNNEAEATVNQRTNERKSETQSFLFTPLVHLCVCLVAPTILTFWSTFSVWPTANFSINLIEERERERGKKRKRDSPPPPSSTNCFCGTVKKNHHERNESSCEKRKCNETKQSKAKQLSFPSS